MVNQIIHGDCFEVLKSFPDNYFDAIITDPPYKYLSHKLDATYDEQFLIDESYRLLNKGFFVFFGRGESFYKLNYLASQKGFKFKEEIVWDKCYNSSPVTPLARYHELISIYNNTSIKLNRIKVDAYNQWFLSNYNGFISSLKRFFCSLNNINTIKELTEFKTGLWNITKRAEKHNITVKTRIRGDRGLDCYKQLTEGMLFPSIFRIQRENYNYQHPTQKPLELIKRLVELTTKEGDIILDPFAGSGTLAIACLETNRKYVCIEKDDEYFEVMKKRISQWHNDRLNNTGTHELPPDIERINYDENSGQLNLF